MLKQLVPFQRPEGHFSRAKSRKKRRRLAPRRVKNSVDVLRLLAAGEPWSAVGPATTLPARQLAGGERNKPPWAPSSPRTPLKITCGDHSRESGNPAFSGTTFSERSLAKRVDSYPRLNVNFVLIVRAIHESPLPWPLPRSQRAFFEHPASDHQRYSGGRSLPRWAGTAVHFDA